MLRKNAVNHILIYRGSFNPPHIGHRALLAHTFFRSSYENTVAAFIVPSSNDLLEEKMGTTDAGEIPAIVLTRAQRAELWQDDSIARWAYTYRHKERFGVVRHEMIRRLEATGVKVEFVCIAGGEGSFGYAADEVAKVTKVQPDDLICSNPMRKVDASKKNGYLKSVKGYEAWKPSPQGDKQLIEKIKNGTYRASYIIELLYPGDAHKLEHEQSLMAKDKFEQASLERLEACLKAASTSQVCSTSKGPKEAKLQYVPAENVPIPYGLPSSTRVRTGIRENPGDERLEVIKDIALNAEKLLEFVDAESNRQEKKKATFTMGGNSAEEEE
jgi:hypothetical protein